MAFDNGNVPTGDFVKRWDYEKDKREMRESIEKGFEQMRAQLTDGLTHINESMAQVRASATETREDVRKLDDRVRDHVEPSIGELRERMVRTETYQKLAVQQVQQLQPVQAQQASDAITIPMTPKVLIGIAGAIVLLLLTVFAAGQSWGSGAKAAVEATVEGAK